MRDFIMKGKARFAFIQKGFEDIPDTAYFNIEDENSELHQSTVCFDTVMKLGLEIVI